MDHYITSDRYLDHRLDHYPEGIVARSKEHGFVDVELARVAGYEVDGFWRSLGETWDRYHLPLALTEVHLGGEQSDEVLWWAEAWDDANSAIASGIPVEAVTSWAAFGSCDWDTLMCSRSRTYRPGCFDIEWRRTCPDASREGYPGDGSRSPSHTTGERLVATAASSRLSGRSDDGCLIDQRRTDEDRPEVGGGLRVRCPDLSRRLGLLGLAHLVERGLHVGRGLVEGDPTPVRSPLQILSSDIRWLVTLVDFATTAVHAHREFLHMALNGGYIFAPGAVRLGCSRPAGA